MSESCSTLPECVQTLFRDKRLRKFRKLFKEMQARALQETFKEPVNQILPPTEIIQSNEGGDQVAKNCDLRDCTDENKEQQAERKHQIIIELLRRDIMELEASNRDQLRQQYEKLREAYSKSLSAGSVKPDSYPYNPDEMEEYGVSFLSYIEPLFVQDYHTNMQWYNEHYNEILLNVSQPSKLEKDFLKHIEYTQQKKSDLKYKNILW